MNAPPYPLSMQWMVGIDPAIRRCGYALVGYEPDKDNYVLAESGVLVSEAELSDPKELAKGAIRLVDELTTMFRGIRNWGIERQVFPGATGGMNASSMMMHILAGELARLNIHFRAVAIGHIKKVVAGSGRAEKSEVAAGVETRVGKQDWKSSDESDAAGVAITALIDLQDERS